MQKSLTSAQGFYVRKKNQTRNYRSVNIRQQNASAHQSRNQQESKTTTRNTASMYVSHNKTVKLSIEEQIENNVKRSLQEAAKAAKPREFSKSSHRYKKLNFSLHKETKHLSSTTSNPMIDFRRKNQRERILSQLKNNSNLKLFLKMVQDLEIEFVQNAVDEEYEKAAQVIIKLLNYTVDLNLTEQFSMALKTLADFYIQCGKINEALFYYNEARESSLLLNQSVLLIESLIGIAKCCSKGNLEKQGIVILKKALEYAWYYDRKQLQLHLYDEIGQKFYHLGDVAKAKVYHLRYINSMYQPSNSAHKSLSKQRIKKNEELNIELKYQDLSILFLVHLKIPIRSFNEIPAIQMQGQWLGQETLSKIEKNDVRDNFNISKKYFSHFQNIQQWINKLMKTWFFVEQMDDPPLSNQDWTAPLKLKKFAYIDFKLNQHLKKFNSTKTNLSMGMNLDRSKLQFKESLDQKITRKLKEPPIDQLWYEKMVQQIIRDHKNKLLNVRNAVKMRGYNKPTRPSIDVLKQLYNKFFERNQKKVDEHQAFHRS